MRTNVSCQAAALRWTALLLVTLLAVTGCARGGTEEVTGDESPASADYPQWIEKVYPPPGSQMASTEAVQVYHGAVGADEQVRLSVDGTDVTTYALGTRPGLLEYDIDQVAAPVELTPGPHSATVELYRVEPGAIEGEETPVPETHQVIDRFTWSFTIL